MSVRELKNKLLNYPSIRNMLQKVQKHEYISLYNSTILHSTGLLCYTLYDEDQSSTLSSTNQKK